MKKILISLKEESEEAMNLRKDILELVDRYDTSISYQDKVEEIDVVEEVVEESVDGSKRRKCEEDLLRVKKLAIEVKENFWKGSKEKGEAKL